jgi:hypothetical protein
MTYYNMSNLTASGINLGEFTHELNVLSNGWLAYGILFIVGISAFIIMLQRGVSIYNAAPISTFLISIIALFMRIITNSAGEGMINTVILIILWVIFFITMLIRVMNKDN